MSDEDHTLSSSSASSPSPHRVCADSAARVGGGSSNSQSIPKVSPESVASRASPASLSATSLSVPFGGSAFATTTTGAATNNNNNTLSSGRTRSASSACSDDTDAAAAGLKSESSSGVKNDSLVGIMVSAPSDVTFAAAAGDDNSDDADDDGENRLGGDGSGLRRLSGASVSINTPTSVSGSMMGGRQYTGGGATSSSSSGLPPVQDHHQQQQQQQQGLLSVPSGGGFSVSDDGEGSSETLSQFLPAVRGIAAHTGSGVFSNMSDYGLTPEESPAPSRQKSAVQQRGGSTRGDLRGSAVSVSDTSLGGLSPAMSGFMTRTLTDDGAVEEAEDTGNDSPSDGVGDGGHQQQQQQQQQQDPGTRQPTTSDFSPADSSASTTAPSSLLAVRGGSLEMGPDGYSPTPSGYTSPLGLTPLPAGAAGAAGGGGGGGGGASSAPPRRAGSPPPPLSGQAFVSHHHHHHHHHTAAVIPLNEELSVTRRPESVFGHLRVAAEAGAEAMVGPKKKKNGVDSDDDDESYFADAGPSLDAIPQTQQQQQQHQHKHSPPPMRRETPPPSLPSLNFSALSSQQQQQQSLIQHHHALDDEHAPPEEQTSSDNFLPQMKDDDDDDDGEEEEADEQAADNQQNNSFPFGVPGVSGEFVPASTSGVFGTSSTTSGRGTLSSSCDGRGSIDITVTTATANNSAVFLPPSDNEGGGVNEDNSNNSNVKVEYRRHHHSKIDSAGHYIGSPQKRSGGGSVNKQHQLLLEQQLRHLDKDDDTDDYELTSPPSNNPANASLRPATGNQFNIFAKTAVAHPTARSPDRGLSSSSAVALDATQTFSPHGAAVSGEADAYSDGEENNNEATGEISPLPPRSYNTNNKSSSSICSTAQLPRPQSSDFMDSPPPIRFLPSSGGGSNSSGGGGGGDPADMKNNNNNSSSTSGATVVGSGAFAPTGGRPPLPTTNARSTEPSPVPAHHHHHNGEPDHQFLSSAGNSVGSRVSPVPRSQTMQFTDSQPASANNSFALPGGGRAEYPLQQQQQHEHQQQQQQQQHHHGEEVMPTATSHSTVASSTSPAASHLTSENILSNGGGDGGGGGGRYLPKALDVNAVGSPTGNSSFGSRRGGTTPSDSGGGAAYNSSSELPTPNSGSGKMAAQPSIGAVSTVDDGGKREGSGSSSPPDEESDHQQQQQGRQHSPSGGMMPKLQLSGIKTETSIHSPTRYLDSNEASPNPSSHDIKQLRRQEHHVDVSDNNDEEDQHEGKASTGVNLDRNRPSAITVGSSANVFMTSSSTDGSKHQQQQQHSGIPRPLQLDRLSDSQTQLQQQQGMMRERADSTAALLYSRSPSVSPRPGNQPHGGGSGSSGAGHVGNASFGNNSGSGSNLLGVGQGSFNYGSSGGGGGAMGHTRTQSSSSGSGGAGIFGSSPLASAQRSDNNSNLMTPRTMLMSSPRGPSSKLTVQVSKQMIGSGAQGRVFLGIHMTTFELVAVKKVELSVFGGAGSPAGASIGPGGRTSSIGGALSQHHASPITPRGEAVKKESKRKMEELAAEIRLMKELQHPSIVRFLSAERMGSTLHLIMEFMGGGSLDKVLSKFGQLHPNVARHYARSVLAAIVFLHSKNVLHRDLKPENILLSSAGDAKICDFGTSRKFEVDNTNQTLTGTPWYMSPEVVRGDKYGTAADIWSFGATLANFFTGKPPWASNTNPNSVMFQIAHHPENAVVSVMNDLDALESGGGDSVVILSQARQVILACLKVDPKERPTAAELMADYPFFNSKT